ncbi:MAG: hypothetical protein ACE5FD_00975 [Anaerolineae bacterium]
MLSFWLTGCADDFDNTPVSISSTVPVMDEETAVRFAVIGDFGSSGQHAEAVADLALGWQPDFISYSR